VLQGQDRVTSINTFRPAVGVRAAIFDPDEQLNIRLKASFKAQIKESGLPAVRVLKLGMMYHDVVTELRRQVNGLEYNVQKYQEKLRTLTLENDLLSRRVVKLEKGI